MILLFKLCSSVIQTWLNVCGANPNDIQTLFQYVSHLSTHETPDAWSGLNHLPDVLLPDDPELQPSGLIPPTITIQTKKIIRGQEFVRMRSIVTTLKNSPVNIETIELASTIFKEFYVNVIRRGFEKFWRNFVLYEDPELRNGGWWFRLDMVYYEMIYQLHLALQNLGVLTRDQLITLFHLKTVLKQTYSEELHMDNRITFHEMTGISQFPL